LPDDSANGELCPAKQLRNKVRDAVSENTCAAVINDDADVKGRAGWLDFDDSRMRPPSFRTMSFEVRSVTGTALRSTAVTYTVFTRGMLAAVARCAAASGACSSIDARKTSRGVGS